MANQIPLNKLVNAAGNAAEAGVNDLKELQRVAAKESPVLAIIIAQLIAQQALIAMKLAEVEAVMQ